MGEISLTHRIHLKKSVALMKENLEIIKEELTGAINQLEFVEGIFKHQNLDASCLEIIEQIKKLQNSL